MSKRKSIFLIIAVVVPMEILLTACALGLRYSYKVTLVELVQEAKSSLEDSPIDSVIAHLGADKLNAGVFEEQVARVIKPIEYSIELSRDQRRRRLLFRPLNNVCLPAQDFAAKIGLRAQLPEKDASSFQYALSSVSNLNYIALSSQTSGSQCLKSLSIVETEKSRGVPIL